MGGFDHLDHEARMAAQRVIVQPDAGENAVNNPQRNRPGGDESSYLRHQTDQRDLSDVDRLTGHVRRGQQHDLRRGGVAFSLSGQIKVCPTKPGVVRREASLDLVARIGQPPLDHRMAAPADHDLAALVQFGPDVVVTRRAFSQRRAEVNVRDAGGHLGDAVGVAADLGADLAVEGGFEFDDPLPGVGDQRFILFQFQGEEAFGVSQSLFTDVITGGELQVRLRDLDVIAEDLVVADLERPYSAAFALARLELRQKIFPPGEHIAQFVKLFGEALADDRAPLYLRRRALGDGPRDVTDYVIAILQSPGEIGRRLLFYERKADRRDGAQAARERDHLDRRGDLPPDASEH